MLKKLLEMITEPNAYEKQEIIAEYLLLKRMVAGAGQQQPLLDKYVAENKKVLTEFTKSVHGR